MIPVALAVVLAAIAALNGIVRPRSVRLDVATGWAAALLLIAAFPILVMDHLIVPAAATVRLVPRGTVATSPFGIVASGGTWPALLLTMAVALLLGLAAWRLRRRAHTVPSPASGEGKAPATRGERKMPALPSVPDWSRFLIWGAFGLAVFNVLTRP
jgi:hypothetical protein